MLIDDTTTRGLITATEVEAAAARIADSVITTPLHISERLSESTGATVYLKREDLQACLLYTSPSPRDRG